MSTSPTDQTSITRDQLCAEYLRRRNQLARLPRQPGQSDNLMMRWRTA